MRKQLAMFDDLAPKRKPRPRGSRDRETSRLLQREEEIARENGALLSFYDAVLNYLDEHFIPPRLTGEDLRGLLTDAGITPSSSNVWGALVLQLVRFGRLVPTDEYRQMQDPRSHARTTRVYSVPFRPTGR